MRERLRVPAVSVDLDLLGCAERQRLADEQRGNEEGSAKGSGTHGGAGAYHHHKTRGRVRGSGYREVRRTRSRGSALQTLECGGLTPLWTASLGSPPGLRLCRAALAGALSPRGRVPARPERKPEGVRSWRNNRPGLRRIGNGEDLPPRAWVTGVTEITNGGDARDAQHDLDVVDGGDPGALRIDAGGHPGGCLEQALPVAAQVIAADKQERVIDAGKRGAAEPGAIGRGDDVVNERHPHGGAVSEREFNHISHPTRLHLLGRDAG